MLVILKGSLLVLKVLVWLEHVTLIKRHNSKILSIFCKRRRKIWCGLNLLWTGYSGSDVWDRYLVGNAMMILFLIVVDTLPPNTAHYTIKWGFFVIHAEHEGGDIAEKIVLTIGNLWTQ